MGFLENPLTTFGKTMFVPEGPRGGGKGEVNLLPLAKRREKREELEIKAIQNVSKTTSHSKKT